MKITYEPTGINNFHNSDSINLVVSGETSPGITHNGMVYRISKHQAARIRRHFCGVSDCQCPAGAIEELDQYGEEFGIRAEWCEEV